MEPEPETREPIAGLVPGRVVYYKPGPDSPFVEHGSPIVADITRVLDQYEGLVNLRLKCDGFPTGDGAGQNPTGAPEAALYVRYDQSGTTPESWRFLKQ